MRASIKWLIVSALAVALSGCVVAPVGPHRAYVGAAVVVPAPVVVVRDGYYWHRW